jgi:hypothetical protein
LTEAIDDDFAINSLTLAEVLLAAEDAAATVASFDERLARTAEMRNLPVLRG